ncbi:hypothetical protein GCM10009116_20480 [Brevundimonas basaltis]|uniref:DUF3887 domain-containing protein n=1 Tax=Brevundimonas basaltis TaxID=472166 RepID=A0A7W8HXP7_9CAUL|nr:hypothetical protein [Brevundimonas basaltis]MBB5291798.1 hypothetical protein [Brevundimonas basaltis]
MKPLLLAAALCLVAPAAAHAQVAAGTLPNTFDDRNARPAPAAPAPAPQAAPAELSPEPADAASEETLRAVIEGLQAGEIDYDRMTADLAAQVRPQATVVTPVVQGFGALVSVAFLGSRDDIDLFNVIFANAETQWRIGLTPEGKVSALLFRPAE